MASERRAGAHDHDHARDGRAPPRAPSGALSRYHLEHLVRPHSHEAADKVDAALESSREGMRDAVDLAGRPRRDGARSGRRGGVVRLGGAARRHPAQRRRRVDRGAAGHRVHPRPPGPDPALHLRLRPRRGPGRRGRSSLVIAASAVLAGYEAVRRLADPQPVDHLWAVAAAGVARVRRQRDRRPLPHPHRPADRLGGAGRRRAARPHRRLHLAGRGARRRRRRRRLAAGRPHRRPAHHRGDRRRAAGRGPGGLPPAHGRRRPRAARAGRAGPRRGAGRARGRPAAAALDRPPAACRGRPRPAPTTSAWPRPIR